MAIISALLSNDGFIQVNRNLIKKLGLIGAALVGELCSQYTVVRENNLKDNYTEEGEFYLQIDRMARNLNVDERTVAKNIKKLKEFGMLSSVSKGIPAKNYYKIDENTLGYWVLGEKSCNS